MKLKLKLKLKIGLKRKLAMKGWTDEEFCAKKLTEKIRYGVLY